MSNTIISVEGNIGSGKSTLLKELKRYVEQSLYFQSSKFVFLQEPVDVWNTIKDDDGKSILERFYANQEEFAFSFQMMAYISRLAQIRQAIRDNPNSIIITERCVYTDRHVFAKMLYDDKKIKKIDYEIYLKWFDEFANDIKFDMIVYVKTDAKIASYRVDKRSRKGENIPLEYLERCNEYHNNWITEESNTTNILEIDGNYDTVENPEKIAEWNNVIISKIKDKYSTMVNSSDADDNTCKAGPYYNTQWLTGC